MTHGTRYAIVAWDFVRTGGMDMANHALAEHLADQEREVDLVGASAAEDLTSRPNVRFHRIPRIARSYLLSSPLLDAAGQRVAATISGQGGRVIVNGGNCRWGDVNWVHYVHAAYEPKVEGSVLWQLKWKLAHRRYLQDERASVGRAKIVIANSARTKADLIRHLGIEPDRIHVAHLGIDPDRFRPANELERPMLRAGLGWPDRRPVVVFIGGLGDRRKGFDTVFAAWERLCANRAWDSDLVVIGSGAELPAWRQRAAAFQDRIRFLGFRADVPEILRASDALVAPARYESYGLGVQEALCCGLPAFVSSSAGVAERYPESLAHLLISNPDDPNELAAKLTTWRECRQQYRRAIAELSATLRAYTWKTMSAKMIELMEGRSRPDTARLHSICPPQTL
jgi:glycosyltransferase involved in cell wall biosynthesis